MFKKERREDSGVQTLDSRSPTFSWDHSLSHAWRSRWQTPDTCGGCNEGQPPVPEHNLGGSQHCTARWGTTQIPYPGPGPGPSGDAAQTRPRPATDEGLSIVWLVVCAPETSQHPQEACLGPSPFEGLHPHLGEGHLEALCEALSRSLRAPPHDLATSQKPPPPTPVHPVLCRAQIRVRGGVELH